MDLHNLSTVASYNSKLLLRGWLFRLFFLLAFCTIVLYQVLFQSNLVGFNSMGLISLSSFIPYSNAYLFTILQTIPLLFLAGMFLTKERRMDSMDAIYYRPESNAEYVVGVMLGFVPVFLVMAVLSLGLGLLIHLFASEAPLNLWLYVFYLVTLVFPALVFMLGFAFFMHSWVRNQALGILILLMVVGFLVFFVGDIGGGLFDPLGITLPNVFAEVTGHAGMTGYLLQRFCWLFVGFGFMGLTVLMFKRLANRPVNRFRVLCITLALMGVGLLSGGSVYYMQREKDARRQVYTEVYNKYAKSPKGHVVSQEIDFEQRGTTMSGKSRLVFRNKTAAALPEIVLYLNPLLTVKGVREEGAVLAFERDEQVVRVQREVQPGGQAELELEYEGKVDEQVCYLDVADGDLYGGANRNYLNCRYGSRFAFLEDDFVLLTPECLWYPVAVPPVNPAVTYDVPRDFTTYTLNVSGFGDKVVVSQGERDETGSRVTFRNDIPMHGISLCAGPFSEKSITVDSTDYQLYLFKGHERLLDGFESARDTLPVFIREFKSDVEFKLKRCYPYARFTMIESPVTFATFYRNEKGSSEYVQPEMVFIPERGMGFWRDVEDEKMLRNSFLHGGMREELSEAELCMELMQQNLFSFFMTRSGFDWGSRNILHQLGLSSLRFGSSDLESVPNAYQVAPLFLSYTISVQSDVYPVMNAVLNTLLVMDDEFSLFDFQRELLTDYLNSHSFRDALYDSGMRTGVFYNVLQAKADELLKRLSVNGVSSDSVVAFTREYFTDHAFREMDYGHFNELFVQRFGVDWADVLPSWYNSDRLPVFWIRDFEVKVVGEKPKPMAQADWEKLLANHNEGSTFEMPGMNGGATCTRFSVYNDGDVDGIVSVVCEGNSPMYTGERVPRNWWLRRQTPIVTRNYLIKAGTGREITLVENDVSTVRLDMNLARNYPNKLVYDYFGEMEYTTDTVQFARDADKSYFLPGPGETIVDNEDEGFELVQSSTRFRVRDWFNKASSREPVRNAIMLPKGGDVSPGKGFSNDAYGLVNRSFAFMIEGSGARMEWSTEIEREGEYDVYAYLPEAVEVHRYESSNMRSFRGRGEVSVMASAVTVSAGMPEKQEVTQIYTISNAGEDKKVVVDVSEERGWFLLGRFHLTPGRCKVSLSDQRERTQEEKDEREQAILGDAIKWVHVGEN